MMLDSLRNSAVSGGRSEVEDSVHVHDAGENLAPLSNKPGSWSSAQGYGTGAHFDSRTKIQEIDTSVHRKMG